MRISYDYLNNSDFLKELAKEHVKTYYVRITVLNWGEEPLCSIEGQVISANLNIDGQSSLRRTANLSIAIDDTMNEITNTENVLSINKKMALEIGYVNTTNKYKEYPILWFPLGIYVIISCSISESSSGLVASLQLQDKMCLLNGTAGGTIPAAADLHLIDTIDEEGNEVTTNPTMYQIIQQLVHHWGGEQLGKIIISDLDNKVKQAMKWNADFPLYCINSANNSTMFYIKEEDIPQEQKDNVITFIKGQNVGYIYTDFIYPGELIADAGSSITDALDQIIQVLGNYEYFYDLDGNFIFQEKKNYLNNAQSKYILDNLNKKDTTTLIPDYIASVASPLSAYLIDTTRGTSIFQFENSNLITSYSNTPQYGAIKNDFVIWGIRTASDGTEIPLRYHLAIDNPPMIKNISYLMFNLKESDLDVYGTWKMPILLVNKKTEYGNSHIIINENNNNKLKASKDEIGHYYYYNGKIFTSIIKKEDEQLVTQNQENTVEEEQTVKISDVAENSDKWIWSQLDVKVVEITSKDWRTQLLIQGAAAQVQGLEPNYYYAELKNEWPRIYNLETGNYYDQVITDPTSINYYLDFVSTGNSKIFELSVDNIGRRSYIKDEGKNVNCIFESQIPDVVLIETGQNDTEEKRKQAIDRQQRFCQVQATVYNNLQIGGIHYSAYQEIRQTLHQFTNYAESITLQTIPLYFLQPNTRISVYNPTSNINGDYLINSLSFSLDNEGLLTINASKAVERI